MTEKIDKDAVHAVLTARAPRAVHLGEVCSTLGVKMEERDVVLDILEELAALGLAKQLPGRRFRAGRPRPATAPPTVRPRGQPLDGRITMHPSGFGFVMADEGGKDVFIPPPAVGGALHGDRVRVDARPSAKGREGVVMEVLERNAKRVGGVFRRAGGNVWIDPDDPRMRGPMTVVGKVAEEVRPGLQVTAEIVRYPRDSNETPEVEILDVLGKSGVTEVEVEKLKIRSNVVEEFPTRVIEEAESFPKTVTKVERDGREDLRGFDLVTIDPADARDHDDALWAERTKDGGYRIIVAIADVSHYVQEGSAIDQEALERGCSIYLPDRAIPMLPRELSSNLASLVPNKDRLTMAVEVELSSLGAIQKYRFIEGVMRSSARLTYDSAARALGFTEAPERDKEAEKRLDMLQILAEAAGVLRAKRTKRGSLNFDLPEPRVLLDRETGEPIDVYRQKGDPGIRKAYNLVEEMMLLANEIVATDLHGRSIPSIYRVHGVPDEDKLLVVCEVAAALGERLDPNDAVDPKKLARFVRRIEGKPNASSIHYLLLRAMQQAQYDTQDVGHFALAAKHYTHFTSPIRRYPDLLVHRVLRAAIRDELGEPNEERKKLKRAAIESSRLERRATELERDVTDLYRAVLMRDRVGEQFEATISGVAGHGFYSSFDAPFVDALTPVEALGDFYELDDLGIRLTGQRTHRSFALGDRVHLELKSVSLDKRELLAMPTDGAAASDDELSYRQDQASRAQDARAQKSAAKRRPRWAEQKSDGRRPRRDDKKRDGGAKPAAGGAKKGGGGAPGGKKAGKKRRSR